MLITIGSVIERIAGRCVESAKRQYPERLHAECAFEARPAVERSDVGRIEFLIIWAGRAPPFHERAGVEKSRALSKKRTILLQASAKLLGDDRLLIGLDVGKVWIERSDQVDRRCDRNRDVDADRANILRQERAVGLFELVAF